MKMKKVVFRHLDKNDSVPFGQFLDNLSEETRNIFGPHPLNSEEAKNKSKTNNFVARNTTYKCQSDSFL